MVQIATSVNQSKKLVELGLSVDTADMWWAEENLVAKIADFKEPDDCEVENIVPAWSLSALIELMPNKICIDNENYYINFKKREISYNGRITWEGQLSITLRDDNLINATFKMVCYLLENKLI